MFQSDTSTMVTMRNLPEDSGVLPSSRMYLHLPSEFAKQALYYAPYVGHFHLTPAYEVRRDNYDYFLFILIESGQLEVTFDGATFVASDRDIVLIDCKEPHIYRALTPLSFRYFHFDGNSSDILYHMIIQKHGHHMHLSTQINIETATNNLVHLAYNGLENEITISALIHVILSDILAQSSDNDSPQDALITQAIAYMEKNFSNPLTVHQLADIVGLSPYYFSRLFRKYTNVSPHAYLVNLRITLARDLLSSSTQSIEQVSERCGFNSVQHFIRCFKQHVDCTPQQYRKQTFLSN